MVVPIHILLCEADDDDALRIVVRLLRDGVEATHERVEDAESAAAALRRRPPDIVFSDYRMPSLTAHDVLRLLHEAAADIPFILVCGQIGEERAATLMRAGARDFVRKDRLSRLAPVVRRELHEAECRHQRRQAQDALRESEQRLRLYAENAPDIIFRFRPSPQARVEYVSPATAAILGRSPEELSGDPRHLLALVHPADRDSLERSWRSPGGEPLPVRWLGPHGTVFTEQRTTGIRDDDGRLLAVEGILRDVTARVQTQRERDHFERRLRQVERLEPLGRLAGSLAHDVNNLLGVILGNAELALDTLPEDAPGRAGVERIRQAAERGETMARRLLAPAGAGPPRPADRNADLNTVVEETAGLLRPTLADGVELVTRLAPGLPAVGIDRADLEHVLINVMVNALAAMPDGGRLTVETAHGDGEARLTVSDTGHGMPAEVAERAFEPFFTTREHGTGLGLCTARGTVEEAGGRATLTSRPGRGTTVRLHLPEAR
ncbi:ATP-binding protein [Nonomuraea sp. NPDC047897]|uniref:hybrid sensor histidine kinase/response regulator n=1 Tax=Nonomuraea sp. NPDC047897 TaxID=3364346 RepID=UPI0037198762